MQVTIQSIPASLQEFETLAAGGRQPERICALFLCALALFDKDRDAGTAAMNLLRGPRPMTPYDAQFLRDRLRGKAYLPLAYFEGATPENGYQPRVPYRLNVLADPRPQDIEPGYLRVFLKTAGADSLGWVCKVLLLVDENADELLAADVRQAVKDQLVDNFIYASVSPTYLAGVIDTL